MTLKIDQNCDSTLFFYYVKMADDDVEVVACTLLILASVGAATAVSYARKKRKHKRWVKEYIRNGDKLASFNTLLPELCAGGKYFQYLRMDVAIFEELYTLVEPEII